MTRILLRLHRKLNSINEFIATRITAIVGTMWVAYAFAALAFFSLPAAVKSQSAIVIVGWTAQTFLQLVLLPIILVGQNVSQKKMDKLIEQMAQTGEDTQEDVHEIAEALDINLEGGETHE